jgi:hypothetical protein
VEFKNSHKEVLVSADTGTLSLSRHEVLWSGHPITDYRGSLNETSSVSREVQTGCKIRASAIENYVFGKMQVCKVNPEVKGQESIFTAPLETLYYKSEPVFYLSIFCESEVYKFYPIYDSEVTKLSSVLSRITGKNARTEKEIIQIILVRDESCE